MEQIDEKLMEQLKAIVTLKDKLKEMFFTEEFDFETGETVLTSFNQYTWVRIGNSDEGYFVAVMRGGRSCTRGVEWDDFGMEDLDDVYAEIMPGNSCP